jgi:hypothetical protein
MGPRVPSTILYGIVVFFESNECTDLSPRQSPGTVVIEVDREFNKLEMLLGMHSWSKFLLKPTDEEVGKASKVFWCTYNTNRWVQKHGRSS